MAGERGVLIAEVGVLLDSVFGEFADIGLGVALVPRETTSEVAAVEPLFDGVEKHLLFLVTAEGEASDERSTMVLVRRHTFNKAFFTNKLRAECRLQPRPRWGGESALLPI